MSGRVPVMEAYESVVFQQALQHRLPWRIDHDWTYEVLAADGYCIAKCMDEDDAQGIIDTAERVMRRAGA